STLSLHAALPIFEDQGSELLFEVHDLQRDETVRDPADHDHQAALAAVQMIANAIHTPSFAPAAANKLFPSESATRRYEVQAVHDWVLFHARHRKHCVGESPSKPPAPGRVYRVYTRDFDSLDELMSVAEMLVADADGLVQYDFEEVGLVEYAPGVSQLRTSSDAITALWRPHGDG